MSQAVKPVRGSTEQPDHIMLSIKGDAATSMTVTWRTCTDIKEGYVLYREDGSSEVMRADAYRISRRANHLTARTIRISTDLSKRCSKRTQTRASF